MRDSGPIRHRGLDVSVGRLDSRGPGLALVVLSVVEQRLDAVRPVLGGADVTEVAVRCGVHRSTPHRWISRYLTGQLAGLADRSHRPARCPHQVTSAGEVVVAEMRRKHPRWGSRRIRMELVRKPVQGMVVPFKSRCNTGLWGCAWLLTLTDGSTAAQNGPRKE